MPSWTAEDMAPQFGGLFERYMVFWRTLKRDAVKSEEVPLSVNPAAATPETLAHAVSVPNVVALDVDLTSLESPESIVFGLPSNIVNGRLEGPIGATFQFANENVLRTIDSSMGDHC